MSVTIRTLHKRKQDGEKFSVLTAYDACFSRLISEAGVDAILVGDSLGNVIQGQNGTGDPGTDGLPHGMRGPGQSGQPDHC